MPLDLPALTVADAAAWKQWLATAAASSSGVWLTLAKKGTTTPTALTYAEALDEALCHGWIDGQTRRRDASTYCHRFTPRTAKSLWSARNVDKVARLEQEGRMLPAGRAAVDAAKADGRWEKAYAGQSTAEPPADLVAAIASVPEAQATWAILNKQNRFTMYYRLHGTKTPAGREKRIATFVEMLARGEMLYPQRQKATDRGREQRKKDVSTRRGAAHASPK